MTKTAREKFLLEILKSESEKSTHYNVLTKEKYAQLVKEVEEAEKADKKSALQHRRVKRFNVVQVGKMKKLAARNKGSDCVKHYLSADELYDVIHETHVAVGHGGRDKMLAETSKKFANVTKEMICLFLSMCKTCQQRKTKQKIWCSFKPCLPSEVSSRCRVDFIDFHAQPDGNFKFVMVYQDYSTKFMLLRALESKKAKEVAYNLNDIFLTIGAPCILQSCNGPEFVSDVISELICLWPELKMLCGKALHSQDSLQLENLDIENAIWSWIKNNNTSNWSEGLRHVQFMKNQAFHPGIKQSPYKAMFGTDSRVGLCSTSLPLELLKDIKDEDDLKVLFKKPNKEESSEDISEANNTDSSITNCIKGTKRPTTEYLKKQIKKIKRSSNEFDFSQKIKDITRPNQSWTNPGEILEILMD